MSYINCLRTFNRHQLQGQIQNYYNRHLITMSLLKFLSFSQATSSWKLDETLLLRSVDGQPHQPSMFKFPQSEFGCKTNVKRAFQATWFTKWRWLHYDENKDVAFCHLCLKANKEKKLTVANADKAFITNGFCNWKDACVKFRIYEQSNCHEELLSGEIVTLPSTVKDVGETL